VGNFQIKFQIAKQNPQIYASKFPIFPFSWGMGNLRGAIFDRNLVLIPAIKALNARCILDGRRTKEINRKVFLLTVVASLLTSVNQKLSCYDFLILKKGRLCGWR
jgi:hypothetical protein